MEAIQSSIPIPYIVRTNASSLSEIKLFILVNDHRFPWDSLSNQECIRRHYQKGDIVLVEDDEEKKRDELDNRQFFSLGPEYQVKGCANHEICDRTLKIRRTISKVQEAAQTLLSEKLNDIEQKKYYSYLAGFFKYLKENELDKEFSVQEPAWLKQATAGNLTESNNNPIEKKDFLATCSKTAEKILNGYVTYTFPLRRDFVLSKIVDYQKKEDIRRIFICTSINFFDPRDPDLKPQAEKTIEFLGKTPFVIINPSHRNEELKSTQ